MIRQSIESSTVLGWSGSSMKQGATYTWATETKAGLDHVFFTIELSKRCVRMKKKKWSFTARGLPAGSSSWADSAVHPLNWRRKEGIVVKIIPRIFLRKMNAHTNCSYVEYVDRGRHRCRRSKHMKRLRRKKNVDFDEARQKQRHVFRANPFLKYNQQTR